MTGTWWVSDSVCDCGVGFAYLDDQVMQCQDCEAVFTRDASPPPPESETRIADALEDIAQALRKIAYPDQWLLPPERPEPFFVIFDGPPAPQSGRYVECETADGRSVRVGRWDEYPGHPGLWRLGPFRPIEEFP